MNKTRMVAGLTAMARLIAAVFAAALAIGIPPAQTAAQTADTLKTLLAFRQCPLSLYLQGIYERPAAVKGDASFLKISVEDRPLNHVRCRFADDHKKLYCEASSYFDAGSGAKPLSLSLPPAAIAALNKLGFATDDAKKNFPYERALDRMPDFDAIAILILTALHDAYGVRGETELKTYAPFAGDLITVCRM